jgi:hypothetical protein
MGFNCCRIKIFLIGFIKMTDKKYAVLEIPARHFMEKEWCSRCAKLIDPDTETPLRLWFESAAADDRDTIFCEDCSEKVFISRAYL